MEFVIYDRETILLKLKPIGLFTLQQLCILAVSHPCDWVPSPNLPRPPYWPQLPEDAWIPMGYPYEFINLDTRVSICSCCL